MMNDNSRNFLGEETTYEKGGSNMKTKMKKLMKNQKGMTLIELLAVIVIIAIIALIAIPAIGNIINKSHDKAILADASQVISGAKIAISDGACGKPETDNTTIICDNAELEDYVDGAKLATGDKVTVTPKSGTTKSSYSLVYADLANIKVKSMIDAVNKAMGVTGTTATTTITDDKLAIVMGNNK
ncbi:prepilin-type N-terminal cleavage/methylation domain-containing protein [Rummeliibacillus pycnus]|uniref:prepilin-type N-terminal cleavage/methylation domain-containing protein n=1 Tax=Rummeliibacillus pycnus TaxID=101070 RepID=UPI0037C9A9DC